VKIEHLRKRIKHGKYLVKSHAVQHALKEGFERRQMVEAVLNGEIIEVYPQVKRALICSQVMFPEGKEFYLHVVCEYASPVYVEIITAYIPDRSLWEEPPIWRKTIR